MPHACPGLARPGLRADSRSASRGTLLGGADRLAR